MDLPDLLPLFPLPGHVLLPGLAVPFRIFEPRYRALVRDLLAVRAERRWLAVPCLAPGSDPAADAPPFLPPRPPHCCAKRVAWRGSATPASS